MNKKIQTVVEFINHKVIYKLKRYSMRIILFHKQHKSNDSKLSKDNQTFFLKCVFTVDISNLNVI